MNLLLLSKTQVNYLCNDGRCAAVVLLPNLMMEVQIVISSNKPGFVSMKSSSTFFPTNVAQHTCCILYYVHNTMHNIHFVQCFTYTILCNTYILSKVGGVHNAKCMLYIPYGHRCD